MLGFYISLTGLADLVWLTWTASSGIKKPWLNREATPFCGILFGLTLLLYVLWFAARLYPLILFSYGGGEPLTVVFVSGEKDLPDGLVRDGTSKRSISYQLLAVTDKSYVVVATEPNVKSFEFSRDAVQGMQVMKEPSRR